MADPDRPPEDSGEETRWKRRVVMAEVNGRRVNEAIERGDSGPVPTFVCECGHLGCSDTVELSVPQYEAVRSDFDRFLVRPGHEIEEVDSVIERHPGYLVVVKRETEERDIIEETHRELG